MPPIYQPEVAAEGIIYAVDHPQREVWVGSMTYAAIVGQKFIPGLLDRYMGRTGYSSQQTGEPVDHNRPDNLYEPVAGDHGARGAFSKRAHEKSVALWYTTHRPQLLLGLGALALAAFSLERET